MHCKISETVFVKLVCLYFDEWSLDSVLETLVNITSLTFIGEVVIEKEIQHLVI